MVALLLYRLQQLLLLQFSNPNPQIAKYFNLYVWFEGQDKQCIDTNSGQPIGNITINVTGESVETPEP